MQPDYKKGFICSSCGSYVRQYTRSVNASMALVLLLMWKHNKYDFFHVENWLKQIGQSGLRADYHKLRFWGLIEAKIEAREDGSKRNGYYKITNEGVQFASRKTTVQSKAVILHNKLQYFEGEQISIIQALGKKFDYNQLMGNFQPKTDAEKTKLKQLSLL